MSKHQQGILFGDQCGRFKEPVLISACFLGIPCRWHARRAKRRDGLIARLKERYILVPICPEQLGGLLETGPPADPPKSETASLSDRELLDRIRWFSGLYQ